MAEQHNSQGEALQNIRDSLARLQKTPLPSPGSDNSGLVGPCGTHSSVRKTDEPNTEPFVSSHVDSGTMSSPPPLPPRSRVRTKPPSSLPPKEAGSQTRSSIKGASLLEQLAEQTGLSTQQIHDILLQHSQSLQPAKRQQAPPPPSSQMSPSSYDEQYNQTAVDHRQHLPMAFSMPSPPYPMAVPHHREPASPIQNGGQAPLPVPRYSAAHIVNSAPPPPPYNIHHQPFPSCSISSGSSDSGYSSSNTREYSTPAYWESPSSGSLESHSDSLVSHTTDSSESRTSDWSVSRTTNRSPLSMISTASTNSGILSDTDDLSESIKPEQSETESESVRRPTHRCTSPIPKLRLDREKNEDRVWTTPKEYSPAAFKFYMEQHIENVFKQHRERVSRRIQLEREMSKVELSDEAKDQMRKMLKQKETNYLRLKRAKMNRSMFDVIKKLCIGAFGTVSLVRKKVVEKGDLEGEQLYAMKTLRKVDVIRRNQVAHVKAERDILAEAELEWVTKLYHSFQDKEHLYFIMEYVPGGDLMALLIKKGIFEESLAKFYIAELVVAIESVHKIGFIHRDIKPDNVLIDKNGHLKLSGFGLCTGFRWTHNSKHYQEGGHNRQNPLDMSNDPCHCSKELPKILEKRRRKEKQRCLIHSLVGTPNYIAPEVLTRSGYTRSCDWWSVGVILYEMLVGQPPFLANSPKETEIKVVNWKTSLHIPLESGLSIPAQDMILQLCTRSESRIGRNGAEEIKAHSFFNSIDFPDLRKQKAPYKPIIKYPTDTSNFDEVEEPDHPPYQTDDLCLKEHFPEHAFSEFTFNRFFEDTRDTQSLNTAENLPFKSRSLGDYKTDNERIDSEKSSHLQEYTKATSSKEGSHTSLLSIESNLQTLTPPSRMLASFPLQKILSKSAKYEKSPLQPHPDYAELLNEIAWVLAGYESIVAPLYCPSPQNPQKLLIQGPGLAEAKHAIKELGNKYPGYEIFVSDRQPVMTSKESNLPIYTHFLTDGNPKMPCYLHKNALTDDANCHVATIGAFLKNDSSDTGGLVFGATSAHALLTKGELQHLAEHGAPESFKARTRGVTDDLVKRSNNKQVLSLSPHNCAPVPVQNSPFITFTHMVPTPESNNPALHPFQRFAADIALLPVVANQLDGDTSSEATQLLIPPLYSEYMLMPEDIGKPSRRVPIGGYVNITDSHDIAKLREANVKILVGGVTGAKLQIQPQTFTLATLLNAEAERTNGKEHKSIPQWMIAPHFAFTADRALPSGNSGAPVMVHNQEEDVLYIIGLLMGSFKGVYEWSTDVLYQAMPFGPALKQLMFLYDEHLTNLRPVVGEHKAHTSIIMDNIALPDERYEDDPANKLVKYLDNRGPMDGYHPVPDEIKQFISGVAQEQEVECGAIYQCPLHPKELEIIGMHTSSMSNVIKPSMSEFPGYSFTIRESSDPRHHVEFRGNDIFSVKKGIWQSRRDPETNRPCRVLHPADSSQCGLMLTGNTVAKNSMNAYYVVVPAHLVLDDALNESLLEVTNTKTMEEMRKEVQSTADKTMYTLHMHNSTDTCDIQPMPLFAYRHFTPRDGLEQGFCKFTNDLAIMKIEPCQTRDEVQTGIIPISKIVFAMKQKIGITTEGQATEIDDIFPLQYPDTLVEMARLGVRVIIGAGQIKGHLVPCGDPLTSDGRTWSFAIEFVTDGWELKEGDCGLILYVQDTREGKRLYPFGMFIGKSLRKHCCGQTIYRAVVLRQALDEIQSDYDYQVTNLRPIGRADNSDTDGTDWVPDLRQLGEEEDLESAACLQATNARSVSGESAGDSGVSGLSSIHQPTD